MSLFKKNQYPPHIADQELSAGKQIVVFAWEVFKVVVISLAIIVPVRYFLIKPFYVKGASMEPNFYDHEYLIINEISYRFGEPVRGDIVVFRYPFDPSQYFIKRVIGLPGEKIKVADGQVFVFNSKYPAGQLIEENYLTEGTQTLGDVQVQLKENEYYLLGDNRLHSLDSRAFGPVKREYIVGKTLWRGWPVNRVGLLLNDLNYNL
ncbi:MAG: signal peptidase I [Candidatus Buchananbacteria bacterium]